MVDLAVVVWVMDLAFWIWPAWASTLRVDWHGSSAKSLEWVSDRGSFSVVVFLFPFPIVGGDEVMGL